MGVGVGKVKAGEMGLTFLKDGEFLSEDSNHGLSGGWVKLNWDMDFGY